MGTRSFLFSLLIAGAMLALSMWWAGLGLAPASAPTWPGDLTGNEQINVADVQCMVLAALDLSPEDPATDPSCLAPGARADINCDDSIKIIIWYDGKVTTINQYTSITINVYGIV